MQRPLGPFFCLGGRFCALGYSRALVDDGVGAVPENGEGQTLRRGARSRVSNWKALIRLLL